MREHEQQQSRLGSPSFVASAIGVATIVVATIVVLVASLGRQSLARTSPTTAHGVAAAALPRDHTAPRVTNPRGCDLPAGDQSVPVSAPPSAWALVGAMAAPSSPATFGPQKLENGVRVCFAHNPTGALYALASFFAESTRVPQAELFARLAASTPARAVAVAQARGDGQLLQGEDGDPGTVSIAGFQYVDYTAAQASITLVLQGPSGELAALPCSLAWQRGDWRFVIPPSQQLGASTVSSMNGFITWSAVSP